MSSDEMRAAIREVLAEMRNDNGHSSGDGHGNGSGRRPGNGDDETVVPQVPAPPVAAVLRPSTWDRPPAPGEVVGTSQPATPSPAPARSADPSPPRESLRTAFKDAEFRPTAPPQPQDSSGEARLEVVTIDNDEDLEQFIRDLMGRLENPRERLALRTGRLRFRLRRSPGATVAPSAGSAAPTTRVEKGAVTERMIQAAAAEGTRLVLAPGAVLTPLAREQARARGVEIERERRC